MAREIVDSVFDITCLVRENGKRFRVFLFNTEIPTLIDTGFSETAETVIESINSLEIEPERLIITHGDGDHIGAFDELTTHYSLETYVPQGLGIDSFENSADYTYGHQDQIGQFEAVHLPGHASENHGLVDISSGIAVMGDALWGADHRGFPTGYFHLPPGQASENLNQAEESLSRLLDYEFSVGLVFHGSSVTEGAHKKLKRYVDYV